VRPLQRIQAFFKLFPDKWRFFHWCGTFWKILRHFKYIFKEVEAFVKITRILKDIFCEIRAFFLKMWEFYKNNEAFSRHFQKNGAFFLEIIKISIIFEAFLEQLGLFQGLRGFLNTFLVELRRMNRRNEFNRAYTHICSML
jgi:hypothetical protein